MERVQDITASRWPVWVNATGLLIASFVGVAALSLQGRPGAEIEAVAFSTSWGAQPVFIAAASEARSRSGGRGLCALVGRAAGFHRRGFRPRRHCPDHRHPIDSGGAA